MSKEILDWILDKLHRLPQSNNEAEFMTSLTSPEKDYILKIRESAMREIENIFAN